MLCIHCAHVMPNMASAKIVIRLYKKKFFLIVSLLPSSLSHIFARQSISCICYLFTGPYFITGRICGRFYYYYNYHHHHRRRRRRHNHLIVIIVVTIYYY